MTEPNEAAKKIIADNKEARAKSDAEREKLMAGKPTPTQDENDMAAVGAHVHEKEDDGSGPDRVIEENEKRNKAAREAADKRRESRQSEADKPSGGGYQTRQATPKPRE